MCCNNRRGCCLACTWIPAHCTSRWGDALWLPQHPKLWALQLGFWALLSLGGILRGPSGGMGCISLMCLHMPGMHVRTCMLLTVTSAASRAVALVRQPELWLAWLQLELSGGVHFLTAVFCGTVTKWTQCQPNGADPGAFVWGSCCLLVLNVSILYNPLHALANRPGVVCL